jgi:rhamnose transport system ATP-binding protein
VSLLKTTNVSKSFAGIAALRNVSFELHEAEVHALVGENGAGKSTLIKIMTGALEADSGSVEVGGRVVESNNPTVAKSLGITVIYQQPALFPDLTVSENMALGLEPAGLWRRVNWQERRRRSRALFQLIGVNINPDRYVSDLTMPEQQLVEIAGALGARARIMIMDEPTASLGEREVTKLFEVIRGLRARGVGIIYISHRLDELFTIADRATVLRDGNTVGTYKMEELERRVLINLMVGRDLTRVFPPRTVKIGETILEARELSQHSSGVRNVSLYLKAGEILGLAGLVGSGRTELAEMLFGLTPADAGQILLKGEQIRIDSPAEAIKRGIAYVPEDRRRHGVIAEMTVGANLTLSILRSISKFGFLNFDDERAIADDLIQRLGIKTQSFDTPVLNLSGGNQQKVAIGRWLAAKPEVLILDEPTQGVDVGAKAEIHRLMGEFAARGMAIIMISSEIDELLGMSDRIAVMHQGRITGTLQGSEATQAEVLALALGHESQNVGSHERAVNLSVGSHAQPL